MYCIALTCYVNVGFYPHLMAWLKTLYWIQIKLNINILVFFRKWLFHRKLNPSIPVEELPGVSIIKPLVGVDPHLFENLETFFNIKYPQVSTYICYMCKWLWVLMDAVQVVEGCMKWMSTNYFSYTFIGVYIPGSQNSHSQEIR